MFYHTPLFLAKKLHNGNQDVNDEIVKLINDALIKLKKDINRKKVPKNKGPNKIVDIVEKILNFDKQQKVKGLSSDVGRIVCVATASDHKTSDHSNLKILTPKQMLQRLPIALAQVKVCNTSENLLNEMRQIIYYLYQAKEINEKVYNNIKNSVKLKNSMDTIFMNSENSKTSEIHRLLLNVTDKINLKRRDQYVTLSNLSIYYTWKNIKKSC